MTTVVSAVAQAQVSIREALRSRPGLDGVYIGSAWSGAEQLGRNWIVIGMEIDGRQLYPAASIRYKEDRFAIHCLCETYEPGSSDDAIDSALDRVISWYGEVQDYLRTTPTLDIGAKVLLAELGAYSIDQGYNSEGRAVQMRFDIDVHTRLISP